MARNITVINTKPYNKQPVPEVSKGYHIFDDGKISYGRHHMATIEEIIPFDEADVALIAAWSNEVRDYYWLYAKETDYFVRAVSSLDENPLYFVRTTDGGWFSFDYPNVWMSARLDIDGSLYEEMTGTMR